MPTPFHVELVTPERVLFSGQVDEVTMRTDEGEISFLAAHEDYVAAVDITVARLSVVGGGGTGAAASGAGHSAGPGAGGTRPPEEGSGQELRVAVHGGVVQVDRAGVVILASVAELGAEIDVERARRALDSSGAELAAGGGAPPGTPGSGAAPAGHAGETAAAAELPGAPALVSPSPAMLALLEPDSALARARRARARLEAAGASV